MTTKSIRDVSLFVKVIGQGYPLLLMHGGPGQDHTSLLPLQPCADQFTLIFYDHRCNGRSEGADVTSMTWENLTADAEALRKCLGFDQWAVLGHSFGGMVALEDGADRRSYRGSQKLFGHSESRLSININSKCHTA